MKRKEEERSKVAKPVIVSKSRPNLWTRSEEIRRRHNQSGTVSSIVTFETIFS